MTYTLRSTYMLPNPPVLDPEGIEFVLRELRRPFRPAEIKFLPKGSTVVAYVDAATVMERLDAVCPGWSVRYQEAMGPGDNAVEAVITIDGVSRSDVGEGDTAKAAYSDGLKRAAHAWGVGRVLRTWRPPNVSVRGGIDGTVAKDLRDAYAAWCAKDQVVAKYGPVWGES